MAKKKTTGLQKLLVFELNLKRMSVLIWKNPDVLNYRWEILISRPKKQSSAEDGEDPIPF